MMKRLLDPALSFLVERDGKIDSILSTQLKVGDKLYTGELDKFVTITQVAKESSKALKVEPYKETPFYVSNKCQLAVRTCGYRKISYGELMNIYLGNEELLKEHVIHRFKLYYHELHLPPQTLYLSPYLIGYWCCKRNGKMLRISRPEVLERIKHECQSCGITVSKYVTLTKVGQYGGQKQWPDKDGFKEITIKKKRKDPVAPPKTNLELYKLSERFGELLHDEDIKVKNTPTQVLPYKYLYSSFDQRVQLLSGILDANGYLQVHSRTYDMTLRDKELLMSIAFLAKSLGLLVTLKDTSEVNLSRFTGESVMDKDGKLKTVRRLWISGDIDILDCSCPNKKVDEPGNKSGKVTGIVVEDCKKNIEFVAITTDSDTAILTNQCMAFCGIEVGTPTVSLHAYDAQQS